MESELPQIYRHSLSDDLSYELALVRAGTFRMGSEGEDAYDDEKPEHLVRLTRDYYLGVYPVTQAVWEAVMGYNPSSFKGPDQPVDSVSWLNIVTGDPDGDDRPAFLDRLNDCFPAANGWRFRLPTEAEWEYAAKGGHHRALAPGQYERKAAELYTLYAGSDKLKEVGWYDQNSHQQTKPIGLKAPNELGVFDMCGNVYEWCWDWTDWSNAYYLECQKQGIMPDPVGPKEGLHRVLRGGGWFFDPRPCRVSYRRGIHPSFRFSDGGFRLVLSPIRLP